MSVMIAVGKCPICGKGPLAELPIGYKMFAAKPTGNQPVGGLVAFQCTQEGHVFFVMARDVEEADAQIFSTG